MKSRFLRALVVGNLAVYGVAAALFAFYYILPTASVTSASSEPVGGTNRPFISLMIPTPTQFATGSVAPLTPIAFDTPIALSTPIPTVPGATPLPTGAPPPSISPVRDRGLIPPSALNIILIGTDRRPGQANWRTDVLILASIEQETKSVGLLSIPRDLWVQIPGVGPQRINTADFYGEYYHLPGGGPETLKRTIEQNLGIRVHYYARVGFDAFRKAIDTLGGVDVDVDCPLVENGFIDDYGPANLNFQPGINHMDGVTALRYARSRYTTNDYDRSRRQRKVLLAMWDKALSMNLLPRWPELYSQFRDSVQTDLGPVELAALAWIGSQLQMDRVKSRAIDNRTTTPWVGPAGEWVLLPQPEKLHSLLVEFFSQTDPAEDPFESEKARIEIVSANVQAANVAAVALKRQGFDITGVQTSSTLAPASSIVAYNQKPATVQRLINALRLNPERVTTAAASSDGIDLQIVLGRDYNSCQR